MQDDYNRFIRRSIKQAQCNYEDIFADSECGCSGSMPDNDTDHSCGCGKTMTDTDTNYSCGCKGEGTMPDMTDSCGCERKCRPMCDAEVPVMAFVTMQPFGRTYNEAEGLCRGTLFPALDKPFTGRGGCR